MTGPSPDHADVIGRSPRRPAPGRGRHAGWPAGLETVLQPERDGLGRALAKSGVFALQGQGAPANLTIKIDNIADIAEAMKKGFGTGLTCGAKGPTVTDGYRITIVYADANGTIEKQYEHALHSTIGRTKPPTDAAPTTPVQAVDQVVEDALIHFIRDMQGEGKLVLHTSHRALRQG